MNSRHEMNPWPSRPEPGSAFTLMDLLVVIGTLSIFTLLLLPALAATKPSSKMAQCLNNQRQLAGAWQMYASDNADLLVANGSAGLNWISKNSLDWTSSSVNTNAELLTNSAYALLRLLHQNRGDLQMSR